LRTTLRIASRTSSATLRPDRAAALRKAASSSLRRYTCVFSMYVTLVAQLTYVNRKHESRGLPCRKTYDAARLAHFSHQRVHLRKIPDVVIVIEFFQPGAVLIAGA